MIARHSNRYGCILGDKFVVYQILERHYVCNECTARVAHKFDDKRDWAECCECGGQDFIHEAQLEREAVDAWEVERGLPEHLRALLGPKEPEVSFEQALQDLGFE